MCKYVPECKNENKRIIGNEIKKIPLLSTLGEFLHLKEDQAKRRLSCWVYVNISNFLSLESRDSFVPDTMNEFFLNLKFLSAKSKSSSTRRETKRTHICMTGSNQIGSLILNFNRNKVPIVPLLDAFKLGVLLHWKSVKWQYEWQPRNVCWCVAV